MRKLSAPSQIRLRNLDALTGARILVVYSPGGEWGPLPNG